MIYKDINKRFTEVVMGYLTSGFYINTTTQRGNQNNIAQVDVTDGKQVIRILLSRDDIFAMIKSVKIIVGKANETYVKPNSAADFITIWNNNLEIISEEVFYQTGEVYLGDDKYYGTREEAEEALKS